MRSSATDNTHIVLSRPNTVLLMATVRDGVAKRSVYTYAITQELQRASGKSDIYELHSCAVLKMKEKHNDFKQIPELRSTLMKRLVLPASNLC